MAIESKATGLDEELSFPKLMACFEDGGPLIVLFDDETDGVVVLDRSKNAYPVGHHASNWDTDGFTDYHGTVTLFNK